MKKLFPYKEQNGVFNYFYSLDKEYYLNHFIEYFNSSVYINPQGHPWDGHYAFTPDNNLWLADNGKPPHYLIFCFKKNFLFHPIGYEITTSTGEAALPEEWSFSGSMSKEVWENNETTTHFIAKGKSHYVPWNHGPFKCFQLEPIKSQRGDATFDVSFIELFGTLYSLDATCKISVSIHSFLFIFILMWK